MPDYPKSEVDLMERVKRLAGPYLSAFAPSSSVPEEFWAALTAGESGIYLIHDTNIPPRFENAVYTHLLYVQEGVHASYGSIVQARLDGLDDHLLRNLASSWGFTQVMGYHALEWGVPVADLNDPVKHYPLAGRLMAQNCSDFGLDPTKDFEEMGRAWNGGSPTSATFDASYIPNLLMRMEIFKTL